MSFAVRDSDNSPSFLSHVTLGVGLRRGNEGRKRCGRVGVDVNKGMQKRRGRKTEEGRHKVKEAGRAQEGEMQKKRNALNENAASSRVVRRQ